MKRISLYADSPKGLSDGELFAALDLAILSKKESLRKVLLLPPDFTRFHSGAGKIVEHLYHALKDTCTVDIMPALGTHVPVSQEEIRQMFGSVPPERFLVHNWREGRGENRRGCPRNTSRRSPKGLLTRPSPWRVNRRLLDPSYDLILSIGQVVPHEVVGMANYGKNIFVGVGGKDMINIVHMLGAFYGLERLMGARFFARAQGV